MNNTPDPYTINQAPQSTGTVLKYASFGRRFAAFLLDGLLIAMVTFPVSLVVNIILGLAFGLNANQTVHLTEEQNSAYFLTSTLTQMGLYIFNLIISTAYYVYFIGKKGQTLGKKALGIKVVKLETQAPPGYLAAFLRETVGKFLSAIVICLGYLWMLWDDKKQTWHDKIAGTIVIRV
jgi:uncharacterized RDD family membrane protein YckC